MTIEPISDERLADIRANVNFAESYTREVVALMTADALALLSRLDKAEAGWQDISTAPRERVNGRLEQVLLIGHFPSGYVTDIVQGWWDGDGWARWGHHIQPSHWRPLPPPPSSES